MPADPKQNRPTSASLGSLRQKRKLTRPYLRPDERPEAFDQFAAAYRRHFQPISAETESLVNTLTYIDWRIYRLNYDETCMGHPGHLGSYGLQSRKPRLGFFLQNSSQPAVTHIPAPLPPKTKPN
jgi:hypothetical protein